MARDVQLVQGDPAAASTVQGPEFVDAIVKATGVVVPVPAEWIGDPVLGGQFDPVPVVDPDEVGEPPTGRSTTAELEAYAEKSGIDLGEASTNAERLAVIEEALAAVRSAEVPNPGEPAPSDPDVQLVAGSEGDLPVVPADAAAALAEQSESTTPTSTDDTGSSVENPAAGNEETAS